MAIWSAAAGALTVAITIYSMYLNHPGLFHPAERLPAPHFARAYGPWCCIVGGSTGIGLAWAHACAQRGLNVLIVARKAAELERAKAEIKAKHKGIEVEAISADLGDEEKWAKVSAEIAKSKEIGFFVFNAAHMAMGPHLAFPVETHIKSAKVNMVAVLTSLEVFLKPMIERHRGAFVLMSSVSGEGGATFGGHYSATKAWTTTMAESMWVQTLGSGVDFLGVVPGLTATPTLDAVMNASTRNRAVEATPESVVAEALRGLGRGPLVYPGTVPKVVAWLQWALPAQLRLRASVVVEDSYKSVDELTKRDL